MLMLLNKIYVPKHSEAEQTKISKFGAEKGLGEHVAYAQKPWTPQ